MPKVMCELRILEQKKTRSMIFTALTRMLFG